ncbi:hypothetical protein HY625_00485 [Candidatus Uhrbacteria bacterium]|nr:hypothetical protein [Candidatus Uhrbacteria bacterium]
METTIPTTPLITEPPIQTEIPKKELTLNLNSQTFFSALLILLVFVSVAQMVQLIALKRTVSTGIFSTPSASAATPSTNSALPNMVGGC